MQEGQCSCARTQPCMSTERWACCDSLHLLHSRENMITSRRFLERDTSDTVIACCCAWGDGSCFDMLVIDGHVVRRCF